MTIAIQETVRQSRYKDVLEFDLKNPAFKEVLSYDPNGNLLLSPIEGYRKNPIRVAEILNKYGENGVVQITDLGMVKKRAHQLKETFSDSAAAVDYPQDKLQLHYAFKANTKGPFVLAALSELDAETSGELDLFNILRMRRRGFIPQDIKIVCNGFKMDKPQGKDRGYARTIIDAHNEGINVTAVLGMNELSYFQKNVTKGILQVGLRLKFGQIESDHELDRLVSRFGLGWNDLKLEAERIYGSKNLEFTMLHAMITAAHTIEPHALAKSAIFAAEKWAQLKKLYPSLTHLNFGGGFPTIDSGFDHKSFLKIYLSGVKDICRKYGVGLPIVTVESGSFVATDAEHLVYPVVDLYRNSSGPYHEMNVAGTIMNIPDVWVQEDPFTFVAVDHANDVPIPVRVGDATCDSNCVYPPKDQPNKYVMMPPESTAIMAIFTGAYQDVLGGIAAQKEAKLVNHCGQKEPKQVYVTASGKIWVNISPSIEEMSNVAGYSDEMLSLAK
jgi:diaminopimelate decarboxylase